MRAQKRRRFEVFLDTGIFVAFLDRSDRWHAAARALFASPPRSWCTSLLVVSEAHSWFLHRLGEEPARAFQALIRELRGLALLDATAAHHGATCLMLDRLRGTKLTYVDASSLAYMNLLGTRQVWGTDSHLSLLGARVTPGSRAQAASAATSSAGRSGSAPATRGA